MNYIFDNTLQPQSLDILSSLCGKTLKYLFADSKLETDTCNSFAGFFGFQTQSSEKLISLNKKLVLYEDSDEYSKFDIKLSKSDEFYSPKYYSREKQGGQWVEKTFLWHKHTINQIVTDIQIFRDFAEWTYINNHWKITSDIAIKISTTNMRVMFVLDDTLSWFIPTYLNYSEPEDVIISYYWNIKSWGMKSEKLINLERRIVRL